MSDKSENNRQFVLQMKHPNPIRITQYHTNTPFRQAHIDQLRFYLEVCKRDGVYYGHKGQFIKRENELLEFLNRLQPDK